MNAPATRLRSPIPLIFALCAAVGTSACGAAPPDAPPPTTTTSPDAGMMVEAGVDGGVIVVPEAGATDASTGDASMADGSAPDGGPNDGGTPEAGNPEGGGCAPGTADCDNDPSNGCESTLSSDSKNCNACGHDCTALPNVSGAGVTCNSGVCDVPASACTTGYGHCSSNPDDGCEANLGTAQTCGSCATRCSGSTPDCSASSSGVSCTDGCSPATLTSCSGSCVDTTSNSANCGSCGHACPVPANGSASCSMNTCSSSCDGGFHSCDNGVTCSDNRQPATCGSSCTPCPIPAHGGSTCSGTGTCGISCDALFHTCDGTTCSDNGSTATCGTSCTPCPVPANTTAAACSAGACGYMACSPGYADCDGDAANGCEVNLTDDGLNCNACGHSCLGGTCSGGSCQPVTIAQAASAFDLTLDANNVYFTHGTYVGSVPKAGGTLASSQSIATGVGSIVDIGATLYALNGSGQIIDGTIPVGGEAFGNPQTTSTDPSSPLVAAGGVPFWSSYSSGTIVGRYFTPIPTPRTLILTAYTAATGVKIETLATAPDGYVAWDEYSSGGTRRLVGGIPSCGGSPAACRLPVTTTATMSGVAIPVSIFADATYVYSIENGAVTTRTRAGALASTAPITATDPNSLVVVGATAYFAGSGGIYSVPVAGGATTLLVAGAAVNQMVADAVAIYWTDYTAGKVMKRAF